VKMNAWRDFLQEQREQHGKVLFTVTELAHVAGVSRAALNVELSRLRQQAILAKYAHGLYGLPGAVNVESVVAAIDSHAYISGHYALYRHHLVSQMPTAITCLTDRRSPRARERDTPLGRLVFVCVRSSVYAPAPEHPIAPPAQALCDYVYLSRRQGVRPEALLTFRNLESIPTADWPTILARYPLTVQTHVQRMLADDARPRRALSAAQK
jgi:hypothetical protein